MARRMESVAARVSVLLPTVVCTPSRIGRAVSFVVTRHTRPTISERMPVGSSTPASMA